MGRERAACMKSYPPFAALGTCEAEMRTGSRWAAIIMDRGSFELAWAWALRYAASLKVLFMVGRCGGSGFGWWMEVSGLGAETRRGALLVVADARGLDALCRPAECAAPLSDWYG